MARVKNNLLLDGISGMIGRQLVFRQTSRGTVVSAAPSRPEGACTPAQEAQRSRFQLAVAYARAQRHDPAVQARYAALPGARPARLYHLLIQEFLFEPGILAVDASAYHGLPGQLIRLSVPHHPALQSVRLQLLRPDGTLHEEGPAQPQHHPDAWHYLATAALPPGAGARLIALVTTHAGHQATHTLLLS